MVSTKSMIACHLKFRDHCRLRGWFYRRMIGIRSSAIIKDW